MQNNLGFELFLAQTGQHPPSAKLLKGLGGGTVELVADFAGDTFRVVYTVRFDDAVYIIHAFKKKSKRGAKTPQTDINLMRRRLTAIEQAPANGLRKERS